MVSGGAANSYESIESDTEAVAAIAVGLFSIAAPEIAVPLAIGSAILGGESLSYNFL
jgi:hypothetical protein